MCVDLAGERLGHAGARAVAQRLPAAATSVNLSLISCGIGDAGAVAVAERMPAGLTSLSLNFRGCLIGDAGAVVLGGVRSTGSNCYSHTVKGTHRSNFSPRRRGAGGKGASFWS